MLRVASPNLRSKQRGENASGTFNNKIFNIFHIVLYSIHIYNMEGIFIFLKLLFFIMLQHLPPYLREDAANSLHFETHCRVQDPVYGAAGIVSNYGINAIC